MPFFSPLSRLLALLPRTERRSLALLLVAAVVSALLETAGVASILPFMALAMQPESIAQRPWLGTAARWFGLEGTANIMVALGIATIAAMAIANAASAANLWYQQRTLSRLRERLSVELFSGYMSLPYAFHVDRDAASLSKVTVLDVDIAVNGFLAPIVQAVSRGIVGVLLLGLVVAVNPAAALGAVVVLGGAYWGVYRTVRSAQSRLGARFNRANEQRNRAMLEGLGGIKELRVLGRERLAIEAFEHSAREHANVTTYSNLMGQVPRYLLEGIAFGGIIALTVALFARGDATQAVPTLALYALAGYRLMPVLQQVYSAALSIRYSSPSVSVLEDDLSEVRRQQGDVASRVDVEPRAWRMNDRLAFHDVTFAYPSSPAPVIRGVSFEIRRRQSIGFVGRTGAGKSTVADLLLGLFPATGGRITVDGEPLTPENVRAWRRNVGYVPQSVFLANGTIAENIAFGVPRHRIDMAQVRRAAIAAQALEFIERLPAGFDTVVGERGVKLSGGQRQRLGIARALYVDPEVLVLDEATSALDGMTEEAVMQAIASLRADRTVIVIAHRMRTVEACDRVMVFDQGRVVADGAPDELMATNDYYRQLASVRVATDPVAIAADEDGVSAR